MSSVIWFMAWLGVVFFAGMSCYVAWAFYQPQPLSHCQSMVDEGRARLRAIQICENRRGCHTDASDYEFVIRSIKRAEKCVAMHEARA